MQLKTAITISCIIKIIKLYKKIKIEGITNMDNNIRGRRKSIITGGEQVAGKRGEILSEIRYILDKTQEEMANLIGFKKDQLSKMERAVNGRGVNDKTFLKIYRKLREINESNIGRDKFCLLNNYLDKVQLPKAEARRKIIYFGPSLEKYMPYRFVGRKKEIEFILQALSKGNDQAIVNLTGINGIGKTYLALEVARRCIESSERLEEPCFDAIIFYAKKLQSENTDEDIGKLSNLDLLLKYIYSKISTKKDKYNSKQGKLELICKELLSQIKTLLIIDTLNNSIDEEVNNFLKSISVSTKILVMDRNYCYKYSYELLVEYFSQNDSLQLIEEICRKNNIALKREEELLISNISCGIPLVIKVVIESITKSIFHVENINQSIFNDKYFIPMVSHIFKKSYEQLSFNSRIILEIFKILPISLTDKFLKNCIIVYSGQKQENALFELLNLGLIKKDINTSNKKYTIYSISSLLRSFISSQDFDYDDNKLHECIIFYIRDKLMHHALIAIDFGDTTKIKQYINDNEVLISRIIPNLLEIDEINEIFSLIPDVKLPKSPWDKIAENSSHPYLNYNPAAKQWSSIFNGKKRIIE